MTDAHRIAFTGRIVGFGTRSGDRFVVGWWQDTPFGPFLDVMHQRGDGHRRLLAPTNEIATFVSATYVFDEIVLVPCAAERVGVDVLVTAGELEATLRLGRRSALGWLLRIVPRRVATAPAWCSMLDPIARTVMRGVRTKGTAGRGRTEWYGATDHHLVSGVSARLDGDDLGGIADLWPPVTFGFGSAPRRPAIVDLTTTIELGSVAGDLGVGS